MSEPQMDCTIDGFTCPHCVVHSTQLWYSGVPAGHLLYNKNVWPVVFKCQFIYRYDGDPCEFAADLQKKVERCLKKRFKRRIRVYGDYRAHWHHPDDAPSLWISLLVDFPKYVKIDRNLEKHLFEDRTPSIDDWTTVLPTQLDHMCMQRLEWFMERAGMPHHPQCYDIMFGDGTVRY
ncbi:hypothetical protein BJX61DRAFT_232609 [Aspergillus egyptiacus]|nr:hypothetical protein BJX61DRAFT_232609 [Aspergillus egyptiacus]